MASIQPKATPGPAQGFHKLLVVADGSEPPLRVVDVAAEMAARYSAALHVLLVLEQPPPVDPEIDAEVTMLQAATDRQREEHCRRIVDVAMSHRVEPEVHVLADHSVRSAVTFARDQAIDLLLVSGNNHGNFVEAVYSELREALLGSRAGQIVHLAPCTAMVVR